MSRITKQEIIELIEHTEDILKERQKNQEGLPWSYSELKLENKDLDFDLIQKRIKGVHGVCATEYFTQNGFVFNPEKGYTEGQLNRFLKEHLKRDYKTLDAFLESNKYTYALDKAVAFIEQHFKQSAFDYFYDKGVLDPRAKEIRDLTNNTIVQFEAHELPQKDAIEGFATEKRDAENGYFPIGIFVSCIFKGLDAEINKLYNYLCNKYKFDPSRYSLKNTDIDGVSLLCCSDSFYHPFVMDAVFNFPQLKFMSFFLEYGKYFLAVCNVHTVYSESGYAYLTASEKVGNFDHKSEAPWPVRHSPDSTFTNSSVYLNSGGTEHTKYHCPFKKEWQDNNFVLFENNCTKISTIQTTKKDNNHFREYRYPIKIWIHPRTNTLKERDTILLKKPRNSIYTELIDASGNIIYELSEVALAHDDYHSELADWRYPPFNIYPDAIPSLFYSELKLLSARIDKKQNGLYCIEIYLK